MKRYQYFTEALTHLAMSDPDAALLDVSPLEPYCEKCQRHIDRIHLKTISAIAKFKKGTDNREDNLKTAVSIASEYGFARTISTYGAAVLALLDKGYKTRPAAILKSLPTPSFMC